MLPEGEIVTIDRVQTGDAARTMYVELPRQHRRHARALGDRRGRHGRRARKVAIHAVLLSGGTPTITQRPRLRLHAYRCGGRAPASASPSTNTRSRSPGPYAVAIHAIDGLGAAEAPADVGSLNDDNFDPAPKQNAGVIGAAVYRGIQAELRHRLAAP